MYHLYRRGAVWWVRIEGERKSTRQKTRIAAEAVAREWERQAADPAYAASHSATIAGAVAALIEDKRRSGRAAATLQIAREKGGHLVRLLPPHLAGIDAAAVDGYITTRELEGAASTTIALELGVLRRSLKHAARRGEFSRPIESVMPISYAPRYVPKTRWLTADELDALLGAMRPHRARHLAFVAATGARWGESVRAEVGDVDTARMTVRLRGTKTAASARTVPIAPIFAGLLARALDGAPGEGRLYAPWPHYTERVQEAARRAGIAPVTPTDLRRTHATWLRRAGVEPHLIAGVLGHTTSAMVERVYGRLDAAGLGERIAAAIAR